MLLFVLHAQINGKHFASLNKNMHKNREWASDVKINIIQEVDEVKTPFFAALKSTKQTKKEPTKIEGIVAG